MDDFKSAAVAVLGHRNYPGLPKPGGFAGALLDAWVQADTGNQSRLAAGFPYVAQAMGVIWEEGDEALADTLGIGPAHRERFSLELGVNEGGERVCALEAGPFDTSADAVSFAMFAQGKYAHVLHNANDNVEWHDLGPHDEAARRQIVGATLNIFTDADGTVRDVDLY